MVPHCDVRNHPAPILALLALFRNGVEVDVPHPSVADVHAVQGEAVTRVLGKFGGGAGRRSEREMSDANELCLMSYDDLR